MRKAAPVITLFLLLISGASAQSQTTDLADAVRAGQIQVVEISGTSFDGLDYAQPLLHIRLQATGNTPLNLTLTPGTELRPTDGGPPMIALELAPTPLELTTTDPVDGGLIAFTTAPALHPVEMRHYELGEVTANAELLMLLQRIRAERRYNGTRIAPQLAVWWQVTDSYPSFDAVDQQINTVFGVSLRDTDEARAAATLLAPVAPTDAPSQAAAASDSPPASPPDVAAPTAGTTEDSSQSLLLAAGIFAAIVLTALWFVNRSSKQQPRPAPVHSMKTETPAPPRAATSAPPLPISRDPRAQPDNARWVPAGSRNHARNSGLTEEWNPGTAATSAEPGQPSGNGQPKGQQRTAQESKGEAQASQPHSRSATRTEPTSEPVNSGYRGAMKTDATALDDEAEIVAPRTGPLFQPSIALIDLRTNEQFAIAPNTMITRWKTEQTQLNEPGISSPHCVIRFLDQEGWSVSDLNSLNGTFVGEQRIKQKDFPLVTGQELRIGAVRLRFEGDSDGRWATLTEIASANQPPHAYQYTAREPYWLITADPIAEVELKDRTVSTPHAFLTFDDGWTIRDLNSTNGTSIRRANASRTSQSITRTPKRLAGNDELYLSKIAFYRFEQPSLPPIGEYVLDEWTGWGGMASVFRGRHRSNGQQGPVVIKLLTHTSPRAPIAFKREADVMEQLGNPPHVVPYKDRGEDPQWGRYLVLGYISGATLSSILRVVAEHKLPEAAVVKIGLHICEALLVLHKASWVHCDVKPENILIGLDGNVALADFGSVTQENTPPTFATHRYLAPEIRELHQHATAAADIWSFGAVLYECLFGTVFTTQWADGANGASAILQEKRVSAATQAVAESQLSEGRIPSQGRLGRIIAACTADIAQRPNNIQQIFDQLNSMGAGEFDLAQLVRQVDIFA